MDRPPLPPLSIAEHRSPLPVLLSIAHSGRDYPGWLVALAAGGREPLESLEDPLVDRLAWRATARGLGTFVVRTPRAAIDCNRAPDELDPLVVVGAPAPAAGGRARHGLGLIPGRTQRHGHLWRAPLDRAECNRRIAEVHQPFHRALEQGLDALVAEHGSALMIDCHSMPPRRGQAELVIGDRHGRSAAPWLTAEAARLARAMGWVVAVNDPYAGGHIVDRHGQPESGVHALQLEFDRRCYLADDLRSPGPGFDRTARLLDWLAAKLGEALAGTAAIAAE